MAWMRRTCGAVWMAIVRVSLRSWSRRSKRSIAWRKSTSCWATSGSDEVLGLDLHGRQQLGAQVLQSLVSGDDIEVELTQILQIELVHLVENREVLQQAHAGPLQPGDELLQTRGELLVAGLEAFETVEELPHQRDARAGAALGQGVHVELPHFAQEQGERLPRFAGVAGADVGQQGIRESRDLVLCRQAVLEHHLSVGHVDGFTYGVHPGLLFGCQLP